MTFSVGSSACHISMSQIRKYNHALVEWYISDDKELYYKFYSNRAAIEQEMGVQLEWNELPEKKASRILVYKTVDFDNKDTWSEQSDWMMDISQLHLSMDEVWLMPFGLLLDLWECHKQYTGAAKPKREYFIDDIIPDGI